MKKRFGVECIGMRNREFDMDVTRRVIAGFYLLSFALGVPGAAREAWAISQAPASLVKLEGERHYTAVGRDAASVWVASALKQGAERFPSPRLERFDREKNVLETEIVLDSETFNGREVRGVFSITAPGGQPALAVLSQWSVEQGDEPALHGILLSKVAKNQAQDWVKLSVAPCVDVEKVTLAESSIAYFCSDGYALDPKTRKVVRVPIDPKLRVARELGVKGWNFEKAARQDWKVPTEEVASGSANGAGLMAQISGPSWGWDQFSVKRTDSSAKVLFEKKVKTQE
jgi:hypothetical protein